MVGQQLKNALGYSKFKGTPRILLLDSDYFVTPDIADAAQELGYAVTRISVAAGGSDVSSGYVATLLKALLTYRPDFVLTVNHQGLDEKGVLLGILNEVQVPVASWFVDHPLPILLGSEPAPPGASVQAFCFERSALPFLGQHGFEEPVYLPTGSNGRHFRSDGPLSPELARELSAKVSFVGNSWVNRGLAGAAPEVRELARELLDRFPDDAALSRLLAAEEPPDLHVGGALQRLVDQHGAEPARRALAVALAERATERRIRFARALVPLGLQVHGDVHWGKHVPGLSPRRQLDYARELPALYRASLINTNVTAAQMPTALNQRVWDVPACGGFLLTDAQAGLQGHFQEGAELVTYHSPEEAADKARYYLRNDSERVRIAARGHCRVEREHRMTDRLRVLVRVMEHRFGTLHAAVPEEQPSVPIPSAAG